MADSEKMREINPSVEFLYKTMLERDPHKRRVKPVQPHLLQLDFAGLDNSSDDSDFKVEDGESGDDDDFDEDDEDEESGKDDQAAKEEEEEEDEEEDDGRSSGVISSKQTNNSLSEDDSEGTSAQRTANLSLAGPLRAPLPVQPKFSPSKAPSEETAVSSVSSKKVKVLICSVCLKDAGQTNDEILECDSCSVLVHEGCFGVCDSVSAVSSESSASMEPWFCDACRAGVKPHCELCPNSGGIFKETDARRWVHLVCALYVPGVAFGDVEKLNNITLFEMNYSKWGSKECCLCEDERFSRTGVCIGCDAGMCRTYFHVTCAQREGLLMEASPDEDIADPFYAYCKQHADKGSVRTLRRNWLALQSHMKNMETAREKDESGWLQLQQRLHRHQQKYQEMKESGPPGWVPKEKLPRMLLTSANALRQLLKKAELLGLHTQDDRCKDIRKKWHVAPALNIDFVTYFLDRNDHISKMRETIHELTTQKEKLQGQEKSLHAKYDQFTSELGQLQSSNLELQQMGEKLWNSLCGIYGRRLRIPDSVSFRNVVKSPAKKDSSKSPTAFIHRCSFCKKTHNQHLLAKCDKCRRYIHLGCLNPPLTRMPKKTKQQGWQCSLCASPSSSDTEFPEVDPDQPRQLREKNLIRGPVKYTSQFADVPTRRDSLRVKKKKDSKPLVPSQKRSRENSQESGPPGKLVKLTNSKRDDVALNCIRCNLQGATSSLVICDRCQNSYHFGCLRPPRTKSPRVRGGTWHCEDCRQDMGESVTENKESDNNSVEDEIRGKHELSSHVNMSNSLPHTNPSPASAFREEKTLASTRTRRKVSLSRRAIENIAYQQKSTFTSGRNGQLGQQKIVSSAVSFVRKTDQLSSSGLQSAKLAPRTTVKNPAAATPYILAGNAVNAGDKKPPNIKILHTVDNQGNRGLLLRNMPIKTTPKKIVSSIAKDFSSNDARTVIEISDDDCSGQ